MANDIRRLRKEIKLKQEVDRAKRLEKIASYISAQAQVQDHLPAPSYIMIFTSTIERETKLKYVTFDEIRKSARTVKMKNIVIHAYDDEGGSEYAPSIGVHVIIKHRKLKDSRGRPWGH